MEHSNIYQSGNHVSGSARGVAAGLAVMGFAALGAEFHFLRSADGPGHLTHTMVQFFSFFTVISNLLVALILATWAVRPAIWGGSIFAASVAAAGVVYILMTGLVYTLFLRQSHSDALGWLVDIALHQVDPIGYTVMWYTLFIKRPLSGRHAFAWLIFPLLFAAASIVRGAISHEYTYVFLDAGRLAYVGVVLMVLVLSLPFLGLGALVIKLNRFALTSDNRDRSGVDR